MTHELSTDVLHLLAGTTTAQALAEKHGVTLEEVARWRSVYLAGLEAATRAAKQRPRLGRRLAMVAAIVLVGFVSREALSASCAAPGFFTNLGLNYFCPNDPAIASQVNANTQQLVTLVQQKVGTLGPAAGGNANIATGVVTATGASITGAATLSGTTNLTGSTNITGALTASNSTTIGAGTSVLTVQGQVAMMNASGNVTIGGAAVTAATDGFVNLLINATSTCNTGTVEAYGFVGGVLRSHTSAHGGCLNVDYPTPRGSFMMPVRKGESYSVSTSGPNNAVATFTPFGT